jgi:hypothetical protein
MATMVLDEPGQYGRVLRDPDGGVTGVVEAKAGGDASAEQLAIREVNTGIFAFDAAALRAALADPAALRGPPKATPVPDPEWSTEERRKLEERMALLGYM